MNDNTDFSTPAELYPTSMARSRHVSHHRFGTLSEAVRFAIEELNPMLLRGAVLEADDVHYDAGGIETLWRSETLSCDAGEVPAFAAGSNARTYDIQRRRPEKEPFGPGPLQTASMSLTQPGAIAV